MFEIGKSYTFHIDDHEGYHTSTLKVVGWDAPLLRLRRAGEEPFILNAHGPHFVRAEPSDHDADAIMIVKTRSADGSFEMTFEPPAS